MVHAMTRRPRTKGVRTGRRKTGKRKRNGAGDEDDHGRWSDMELDVLHTILMKLNVVDYAASGAVCRSWRAAATNHWEEHLACQAPLAVLIRKGAQRMCSFRNFFTAETFRLKLPYILDKRCVSFSSGYLVMECLSTGARLVVHPFKRHQLSLPFSPYNHRRFVLVSLLGWGILVVSSSDSGVHIYRPGHSRWINFVVRSNAALVISDVAVFNGDIVVLTTDRRVFLLLVRPRPRLARLNFGEAPPFGQSIQFVVWDAQLLVLDVFHLTLGLYKLDFPRLKWCRVESLGGLALFVDYKWCSALCDLRKWNHPGDCICVFEPWSFEVKVYSVTGHFQGQLPGEMCGWKSPSTKYNWREPMFYFPQQSHRMTRLSPYYARFLGRYEEEDYVYMCVDID